MKSFRYRGARTKEISERELCNRWKARMAALEGMVLLKNEGILPINVDTKVALCGGGAVQTVKGGTGSGDVNEREAVSIAQGFKNAGLTIVNADWLSSFESIYQEARLAWRAKIWKEMEETGEGIFEVYARNAFRMPGGNPITGSMVEEADVIFYVISRVAGEAADRRYERGDYFLTEKEKEDLEVLHTCGKKIVVILNVGGPIDLAEILTIPEVQGLILMGQAGMEGGNALADLILGKEVFSGKLTDTWAKSYLDYPNAETFSYRSGDVEKEYYQEGIYVGYRYFDTFSVPVSYGFGYGLSYTDFSWKLLSASQKGQEIELEIAVTNAGSFFAGKETVQVYVSCPQGVLLKEHRRLAGFCKTKLLAPGEKEILKIQIPAKNLASFQEETASWILEEGSYGFWVGTSLSDAVPAVKAKVARTCTIEKTAHICPIQEKFTVLEPKKEEADCWEQTRETIFAEAGAPTFSFIPEEASEFFQKNLEISEESRRIAESLTSEELIDLMKGAVSATQDVVGSAGVKVPGAAGETSSILEEKWGIPGISMADGPAGLRLYQSYEVNPKDNTVFMQGFVSALERGFFAKEISHSGWETFYQYCTAIPTGTVLAQTWNLPLLEEIGAMIAGEMQEFGISWWLAPGMNIHRNPLCGRNFEYFSEDPLVSGKSAAAITRGVQSLPGTGTTIKHFACNNQEDNRKGSDSILHERTLRELYVRNFEIAVKESQPFCIMTSYNLINGVHAANNRDLCTVLAREEWGFKGIIMTDWTTTMEGGGSLAWKCVQAGNDLIMPGALTDVENIREALESGELQIEDLKACAGRMVELMRKSMPIV